MVSKQTGQKLTSESFSFGIKYKIVKADPKLATKMRYEHKEDGHNKFYIVEIIHPDKKSAGVWTHVVVITYGKIGTQGSTQKYPYMNEDDAKKFMQRKINEKLKKGYKRVA